MVTSRLPSERVAPGSVRRMVFRSRACLVLLLTAALLPAQFFQSIGAESRRTTRVTWLGRSGEQTVAIDHGQPTWRAEYDGYLAAQELQPLVLGKGASTELRNDVELSFGDRRLPAGRWYVGARRDAEQQWDLAFFAAAKADATGRVWRTLVSTEPDVRVRMAFTRETESVAAFEITLAESRAAPTGLTLALAWGPIRLRTDLTAAFDVRLPDGAPQFAETAAGNGVRTGSGLVYEVLREGRGAKPRATDVVHAHYTGWLTDGTMFCSSHVGGEPEPLRMEWVVKGFAEGLQLMQPGAVFRLTIPAELAFGARGTGRVPPDASVVYVVTLVGIDGR